MAIDTEENFRMLKKTWLNGFVALGLMAGSTAFAAEPLTGFYAGAGLGQSTLKLSGTSFDEHDTSFKIFGGYSINRNFAVEAAYFDGGNASVSDSFSKVTFKISGVDLSVVGSIPFAERFSV